MGTEVWTVTILLGGRKAGRCYVRWYGVKGDVGQLEGAGPRRYFAVRS